MKKHLISLLVLFLLVPSSLVSVSVQNKQVKTFSMDDTPGVQWSHHFGGKDLDVFEDVQTTSDGGTIIVGETKSFSPDLSMQAWVVKTDAKGIEEWNHTYSSWAVFGTACQQTTDGGYAFCGCNNQGNYWLVKTDVQGIEQWNHSYQSGAALDFQQTTDGGYIISGNTNYIIRTDSQGNAIWTKSYMNSRSTIPFAIQQTSDDGFIIAGRTTYYTGTDNSTNFLLKLDRNGTEQWNKTYWRSAEYSAFFCVHETNNHDFIVGGMVNDNPRLYRINTSGNEIWNRTYQTQINSIKDIAVTNDNGFILLINDGYFKSLIIKTDENGTEIWELPLNWYLDCIQQSNDGGFFAIGDIMEILPNPGGLLIKIGHVPHMIIIKPTNALYLFDRKIIDTSKIIALGKLTIEVDAYDTEYIIERVEFLVDGVLKNTDTSAPYCWKWTTPSFSPHLLTMIAYNSMGNCSSQTIEVWKIF